MNHIRTKRRTLRVILALSALAMLLVSLGCEPILTPAGHKPPNPVTPRVGGGTDGAEQSTLFISFDPPFAYSVKWHISNDFDGWLRDDSYVQTYAANWLSVHNWDVLPDII